MFGATAHIEQQQDHAGRHQQDRTNQRSPRTRDLIAVREVAQIRIANQIAGRRSLARDVP